MTGSSEPSLLPADAGGDDDLGVVGDVVVKVVVAVVDETLFCDIVVAGDEHVVVVTCEGFLSLTCSDSGVDSLSKGLFLDLLLLLTPLVGDMFFWLDDATC